MNKRNFLKSTIVLGVFGTIGTFPIVKNKPKGNRTSEIPQTEKHVIQGDFVVYEYFDDGYFVFLYSGDKIIHKFLIEAEKTNGPIREYLCYLDCDKNKPIKDFDIGLPMEFKETKTRGVFDIRSGKVTISFELKS